MKDWLFLMANLFLLFALPLFSSGQAIHDTLVPADTIKKQTFSIFLNKSIVDHIDTARKTTLIPTFFRPHSLKFKSLTTVETHSRNKDWAFLILFTCFGLFVWMQFYFQKRLDQIIKAFLTGRYFNQLLRAGDVYNERLTVNLFLIFILTVPLFIFEINYYYRIVPIPEMPFGNLILYAIFMAIVLVFYGSKILVLHVSGVIFKTNELTAEYILTHFVFNLIEGLLLVPLLLILIATSSLLVLDLVILVLIVASGYRLLRGLLIGLRESKYSIFYLVIFFITVEILPLLVFWKLLQKNYPV